MSDFDNEACNKAFLANKDKFPFLDHKIGSFHDGARWQHKCQQEQLIQADVRIKIAESMVEDMSDKRIFDKERIKELEADRAKQQRNFIEQNQEMQQLVVALNYARKVANEQGANIIRGICDRALEAHKGGA